MRFAFLFSLQVVAITLCVASASAADTAGHALAQKFATGGSAAAMSAPKKTATVQRPAKAAIPQPALGTGSSTLSEDESEMLAAARAEADARKSQSAATVAEAAKPLPQPQAQQQVQPPQKAAAPKSAAAATTDAAPVNSTVLVVLTRNSDHEQTPKTFDPIVCFDSNCYVSTGVGSTARPISRSDALSANYSMSTGAGACAGKPNCAFRGVTFPSGAGLQIIDLGLVRQDAHEALSARADPTCIVDEGDLICRKPLAAPDYRVWIVPEDVANKAGADKLTAALAAELPEENVTLETDK